MAATNYLPKHLGDEIIVHGKGVWAPSDGSKHVSGQGQVKWHFPSNIFFLT